MYSSIRKRILAGTIVPAASFAGQAAAQNGQGWQQGTLLETEKQRVPQGSVTTTTSQGKATPAIENEMVRAMFQDRNAPYGSVPAGGSGDCLTVSGHHSARKMALRLTMSAWSFRRGAMTSG